MSIQIGDVLDYLDIHPVNQHDDAFSAMELVFHAYSMYNTMDNEIVQKLRESAFSILDKLPDSDAEKLLDIFCDYYMETCKLNNLDLTVKMSIPSQQTAFGHV